MARIGLIGPSYTSQSPNVDAQKTENFYVEQNESGQGKSAFALCSTPGTKKFVDCGGPSVRGQIQINGRCFAVSGGQFGEVTQNNDLATGTFTAIGNVADDGSPVSMAASNTQNASAQILIASAGHGYVYNLTTKVFVADPVNLINPIFTGYADGFFVALQGNSDKFQLSSLLDATTWSLVDTFPVSRIPDNVLSLLVDHNEIWLFGYSKTLAYYNSGDTNNPWQPIPGAFIEQGIGAIQTPTRIDNSIFWLGADDRGGAMAWRAQGYLPTRISNHAVENAWQSYRDQGKSISDAVGYAFQERGHSFWHVYFPSANKSWRFDVATSMWHEVSFWKNGAAEAHHSQNHSYVFGKHLVGDWSSGKIYWMATPYMDAQAVAHFCDDDGNLIRRVRRTPHIATEKEFISHSDITLDVETGLGPQPPLLDGLGKPRDPQLMLRWSDSNGKRWSNERVLDCGKTGEDPKRVVARRLGRSRGRIYELEVTDPVPWYLAEGYLGAAPSFGPQERLVKQMGKGV